MPDVVVNDARPLVQYVADGLQSAFTYPFPILAAQDLAVAFDDGSTPGGVTVAGVGDSAGGTVTFADPPAAGLRVTLYRDMPVERTTDFLDAGEFRASAINAELDRLAMMIQQVEALAANALRRAPEDADLALILPNQATRAGGVLAFDAEGLPSVSEEPTAAAARAETAADAAEASQAAAATSAGNAATAQAQAAANAAQVAVDIAAERRRADRVAVRARQSALAPSVAAMPVWAMDVALQAGLGEIGVARSGAAHVTDASGALVAAAADTPRFDHDPATGAPLGLLLEGQRTNLLHDSFAPATQTRTLAAGTYTLSVRGGGSCTLSGGPAGTAEQSAPVTFTLAGSTAVTFTVGGDPSAIQCEAGQSATSPIQTPAGGPATRHAETLTIADTSWLDVQGLSVVIDARLGHVPAAGALRLFSLDDGSDANRHEVYWSGDIDRVLMFAKADGASQGSLSALVGAWDDGETHRIGITLGGGARAIFADGAKEAGDGVSEPAGLTHLRIGRNFSGTTWNGHVLRVAVYPRALPDADMIALTA